MIATICDRAGRRVTISTGEGSQREAALLVASECDRRGMFVETLSTPESIAVDLRGRHGYGHTPEHVILGGIGRLDLAWVLPKEYGSRLRATHGRRSV
jgi:hypothetical protein